LWLSKIPNTFTNSLEFNNTKAGTILAQGPAYIACVRLSVTLSAAKYGSLETVVELLVQHDIKNVANFVITSNTWTKLHYKKQT
jgi:hypothetical protein